MLALGLVNKPLPFLTGVDTALPTMIMINLWQGIPFFTINLLAGLKAIDQELYEAAAIDGATKWRQFLHITLPGLRYVIIVVTLLSTIWTFNGFGLIFLLTGGGPMDATKVYSILAYQYAITGMRYGPGIAVAMTMAPVLGIFIVILGRYMMSGRRLYEDSSERENDRACCQPSVRHRVAVSMLIRGTCRPLLVDQQHHRTRLGGHWQGVAPPEGRNN